MKSLKSNLIIAAALLFLLGCATGPKISNETNPEIDFSPYQSFSLLPLPTSLPGADPGTILRNGKAAQDGIRAALEIKGYTETDLENADFVINLKGSVVPKVKVTDWGMGMGYGSYGRHGAGGRGYSYSSMGTNVDIDNYEEGTFILEVFDVETKNLAWVGWAVGRKRSEPMPHDELKLLIAKMFESFPGR